MKSKLISIILSAIVLMVMLTGCGQDGASGVVSGQGYNGDAGEEIVIQFGIHVANPSSQERVTYEIVQVFNEVNEGQVRVEFVANDTESHLRNMMLAATDDSLPHIFWLDSAQAVGFAEEGYLLDLSSFLYENPEVANALEDSAKEAFRSDIQYGLPYQSNVSGFFYNIELFSEHGIQPPINGTTFEELLDMVDSLNEVGIVPIAQGYMNSGFATWGYFAMLDRWGYSEYIHEILQGDMLFHNDYLFQLFGRLQELEERNAFAPNMSTQEYFDAKEMFVSGQAAMFNTGSWDSREFDERMGDTVGFWWGPTFMDSPFSQERAMMVPSAPLVVSVAVADNDAIKEAVYEFLAFYYSEKAAEISVGGSIIPATNFENISISDDQFTIRRIMESVEQGWINPAVQPDQLLPPALQSQLYDSILGVLLGNYTPERALDLLDQQADFH